MKEFWEKKFTDERTLWGFEPSDSAVLTRDFFVRNKIKNILIPGFGYGRNAKIFHDCGINVTGIEISKEAITMAKTETRLEVKIYQGSVTDMPFDQVLYDGVFCYALAHLLNKFERKQFIKNCFSQLRPGGFMVFTVISRSTGMYGKGKLLSKDRFEIMKGLKVFFYDLESVRQEFGPYGMIESIELDEPIKHMGNEPPLKCIYVKCRKKAN